MTQIPPGRPLKRQTAAACFNSPIIVELHPKHLTLRLKGHLDGHTFLYDSLFRQTTRRAAALASRTRLLNRALQRAS